MRLLDNVNSLVTGDWVKCHSDRPQLNSRTFQGAVQGTGTVSASIEIEVCNDQSLGAISLGTITLSGTTSATDGFAADSTWNWVRARVSTISGTGAKVSCVMGL